LLGEGSVQTARNYIDPSRDKERLAQDDNVEDDTVGDYSVGDYTVEDGWLLPELAGLGGAS
jgi:hypothetical protein